MYRPTGYRADCSQQHQLLKRQNVLQTLLIEARLCQTPPRFCLKAIPETMGFFICVCTVIPVIQKLSNQGYTCLSNRRHLANQYSNLLFLLRKNPCKASFVGLRSHVCNDGVYSLSCTVLINQHVCWDMGFGAQGGRLEIHIGQSSHPLMSRATFLLVLLLSICITVLFVRSKKTFADILWPLPSIRLQVLDTTSDLACAL